MHIYYVGFEYPGEREREGGRERDGDRERETGLEAYFFSKVLQLIASSTLDV